MTRSAALALRPGPGIAVVMMLVVACAGAPAEAPAEAPVEAPAAPAASVEAPVEWPLACSFFPPEGPPLEDCARRDGDGEVVLRSGVWPEDAEPDAVRVVLVEGELRFALASGRTAPALPYDNGADYFVEGLARSPRDGKVGFVDEDLELVVPREWDFAFPFEDGVAVVCSGCGIHRTEGDEHSVVTGGRWGYVDRTGRVVVPVVHPRDELPPPTGAP